jgi:hypothetical protein
MDYHITVIIIILLLTVHTIILKGRKSISLKTQEKRGNEASALWELLFCTFQKCLRASGVYH